MENAAKALLISAGVLLAILLLTLFVYLFSQMGQSTASIYRNMEKHEIAEFNQQFLNYDGRDDLTAQDIATLINLAINNNKNPKFPTIIHVKLGDNNLEEHYTAEVWLKNKINSSETYRCTRVHVNTDTLLVDEVSITKIIP